MRCPLLSYSARAICVLLLGTTTHAIATTLIVESDGSGDYPTIQAAIDAATPGDTIQLGFGVFDDYIIDPQYNYAYYVRILKDNLTIRGAGMDESIIGRSIDNNESRWVYLMTLEQNLTLRLEDLTLQLCDRTATELLRGLSNCSISANRCSFRNSGRGIVAQNTGAIDFVDCEFSGTADIALAASIFAPSTIRNTKFEHVQIGVYTNGSEYLTVSDCIFDGSEAGPNSAGGCATGFGLTVFERCTFMNHTNAGLLIDGVAMYLSDCVITESTGVGFVMVRGVLGGSGNTIYSESCVFICEHGTTDNFNNNHFIAGGSGLLARTYEDYSSPRTIDFQQNWWGTDNVEQIAAGIWDQIDDPNLRVTIGYLPILGGPVYGEGRTWSDVKALFR